MFEHIQCEQNSPEWYAARLGKITASSFNKYVTATGKISSSSATMNKKLVEELVTGQQSEYFKSDDMERGLELEPHAISWLNKEHNLKLEPVGFFDSGKGYGASLDAVDWDKRIHVEAKCPILSTHLQYILDNKVPTVYYSQIQGQLLVSGFEYCYFLSYHPTCNTQLVLKVERDEEFIEKLRKTLESNAKKIDENAKKLKEMGVGLSATGTN